MAERDLDDVAEGEEEQVWRYLVGLLRADPTLMRVVKTWVLWDRGNDDAAWPTEAQTPWLRLTPTGQRVSRVGAAALEAPLLISVETCVSSRDPIRRMRFWTAIRRAILPVHDPDKLAAIRRGFSALNVRNHLIIQPAWSIDAMTREQSQGGLIVSSGELRLDLRVAG